MLVLAMEFSKGWRRFQLPRGLATPPQAEVWPAQPEVGSDGARKGRLDIRRPYRTAEGVVLPQNGTEET